MTGPGSVDQGLYYSSDPDVDDYQQIEVELDSGDYTVNGFRGKVEEIILEGKKVYLKDLTESDQWDIITQIETAWGK